MPFGMEIGRLKGTGGQLEIQWEIADFLSLWAEIDAAYRSPVYILGDTSWYIELYPNGQECHSSEGWIGLYVIKGDSGPPVTATYCLFLKRKDGREARCKEQKNTFKGKDHGWGNPKRLRRSDLIGRNAEFLPSGSLTVVCTLKLDDEREVKANESTEACTQTEANTDVDRKTLAAAVQGTKLLRDLKKLCHSGENCDVILQVSGQKFEAHRCILAARSPVFASMLSHDMKEMHTGLIDVVDCDQKTFGDFLGFLYCGNVESITSQNACRLYKAADKYDVQDLKSECLAYIKGHLDVDNFCDVITLALRHREGDLVKQAIDFFSDNMLSIIVTVKWQVFVTENPIESNELTIKALTANKGSNGTFSRKRKFSG